MGINKFFNSFHMGGSHASTQESASTVTDQHNVQNNSQSYNNEFGNNQVSTGNVGAGGTVLLLDLHNRAGQMLLNNLSWWSNAKAGLATADKMADAAAPTVEKVLAPKYANMVKQGVSMADKGNAYLNKPAALQVQNLGMWSDLTHGVATADKMANAAAPTVE